MATNVEPGDRPADDYVVIFTKRIRLRNGRILFAESYGLEAFCIKVKRKT